MHAPQLVDRLASFITEVALWGHWSMDPLGATTAQHLSKVRVSRHKGVTEVAVDQATIRVGIVPSHERVDIVLVAEDSQLF